MKGRKSNINVRLLNNPIWKRNKAPNGWVVDWKQEFHYPMKLKMFYKN